jgi:hypothetical protein
MINCLATAEAHMFDAMDALASTRHEWRGKAIIEAFDGFVQTNDLRNAIDRIMDDVIEQRVYINPTFTRPKG